MCLPPLPSPLLFSPPAWARAADEWQRITDEDTVTRLTLLHSRGEGKGREGQRQCGRGGANRVLGLQMGGVVVGGGQE